MEENWLRHQFEVICNQKRREKKLDFIRSEENFSIFNGKLCAGVSLLFHHSIIVYQSL